MKKLLLILLCLPFIGFGQNVSIPDANFKAYLVANTAINTNGDTEIQVSEAASFSGTIDCFSMNIADLTGIEAFTALTFLNFGDNLLTSLDVSQNTALTILSVHTNQLTSLDVSNNTALTVLSFGDNLLTSFDVSNNTALTSLDCRGNQLTSLDVSTNTALIDLNCNDNQLTSLDVSTNTSLELLLLRNNQLTSLDVSTNTALSFFSCRGNQLTTLDVSQNIALTFFYCYNNQLTSLDVRNGNNIGFQYFETYNNPNLYCINVDDVPWADTNWTVSNGNIDAQHYFSISCPPIIYGCTDSLACNYDSLATIDDSSCISPVIWYQTHLLCDGDSIVVGSSVYDTTGAYTDTLSSANGCDSVVNTNLTIEQNTSSYDTISAPPTVIWQGMTLTMSGDYTDTLINSVGCDSIANLNLTIINTTGILDITNKSNLIKITDMLGQETPYRRNTPLLYLYDDGTVEKRIIIE